MWHCGQAGGGDPADLDGNIILCGRTDRDADRFFNGSIAHLALFDSAVTQFEVATLYSAYAAAGKVNLWQDDLLSVVRFIADCFDHFQSGGDPS